MPLNGREVQLTTYPRGEVQASDFRIVGVDAHEPRPGEVLVRNTWTSVDAGLRLRLREKGPEGYFPAFPLDAPMEARLDVRPRSRLGPICRPDDAAPVAAISVEGRQWSRFSPSIGEPLSASRGVCCLRDAEGRPEGRPSICDCCLTSCRPCRPCRP